MMGEDPRTVVCKAPPAFLYHVALASDQRAIELHGLCTRYTRDSKLYFGPNLYLLWSEAVRHVQLDGEARQLWMVRPADLPEVQWWWSRAPDTDIFCGTDIPPRFVRLIAEHRRSTSQQDPT